MNPFSLADKTQEYDGAQTINVATLGKSSIVTWDLSTQQNAEITLTGNITMGVPTGWKKGRMAMLEVIQGGSGSYTVSWSTQFTNQGVISIQGTVGSSNILIFKCIDNGKVMCISNSTCSRTT